MTRILAALCLCLFFVGLVACGGGSSAPPPPTPTPTPTPAALTVSPSTVKVALGKTQQFSATGPAVPVNWSVNGVAGGNSTVGTIDVSGFYTAPLNFPSPNTFNVTATSQADPTKTANSALSVVYPNKNNTIQTLPIKLGSIGGNALDVTAPGDPNPGCCIGTLGSLIQRGTTLFILSNNHVLARSEVGTTGEAIDQPGPNACFTVSNAVATLSAKAALKPTTSAPCVQPTTTTTCGPAPSNVDAAIAQTSIASTDSAGTILELGTATSTDIGDAPPSATLATASIGLGVAKSGRTTGLTCSTIESISGRFAVDYDSVCGAATAAFQAQFSNQISVTGGTFIEPGDSGSLLVTSAQARPVGLLYAGSPDPGGSAIANPIQDVLNVFNNGTAPTIVGGADHAVSCQPTLAIANSKQTGAASALTPQQRENATVARNRNAVMLMSDPAVKAVTVGASADNPQEGAVLVELSAAPQKPIPATVDGVRTRVMYPAGAAIDLGISSTVVANTIKIKDAHENSFMGHVGIRGIAVGRSNDNPADPAIIIYTTTGMAHPPIPAVIDGVRTRVIEGKPFRAY